MSNRTDPSSMFRDLLNEANAQGTTDKTASHTGNSPFGPGFFGKLASDASAQAELVAYTEARVAEGASEDEIANEIASFEAEEMADGSEGSGEAGDGDDAGEGSDGEGADLSEFDLAKEAAEAEAADLAFADAVANSELGQSLGIDQEKVAQFLIDEAAGVAYAQAYNRANEIIEKIANFEIPSQEDLDGAVEFLKAAGVNVDDIAAQAAEFEKQASEVTESVAVRMAREVAEAEQSMIDALATLQAGGFDITKVAADAEGKKKMSGKAKAALGLGAAAGTAALGLAAGNKAMGGRFSARAGASAMKEGLQAAKGQMSTKSTQGLKDRVSGAAAVGKGKAQSYTQREKALSHAFRR